MVRVRKTLQFTPNIDLFASHLNHKYRPYCSYVRDPGAMHIDCFTLNWANWRPYAFPPFSILDRVMAKIEEDGIRDIAVIAPVWPSAMFFARMLQHLKAPPRDSGQSRQPTFPPLGPVKMVPRKKSQIGFTTFVRYLLRAKQVPQGVAKYIVSNSWKESTIIKLNTATRRWVAYCRENEKKLVNFTGRQCLDFLYHCVEKLNLSFYAMRATKEFLVTISKLLTKPLSSSDLECMSKFIRGVFNARPPVPYTKSSPVTWNVDIPLTYIKNGPSNEEMGMSQLGGKIAMLILLANMCRISDVAQLDLAQMTRGEGHLSFWLETPTKTFTKANMNFGGTALQTLVIEEFEDEKLCPVRAIECYIERSKGLRGSVTKLFIVTGFNPNAASIQSISRWAKRILKDAGLGEFTVHSGRSASASNALLLGLPISSILRKAGWHSESTFIKKYMKNPQCILHDVHGFSKMWSSE